jgi:hypothetical protein
MWTEAIIANLKVQLELWMKELGRTVGDLQRSAQYVDPVK